MSSNPSKEPGSAKPELPPNVLIFSPKNPNAAKALNDGRIFTRLTTTAATTPEQLSAALERWETTQAETMETFCLVYRHGILIYDGGDADTDADQGDADMAALQDAHHEHFRLVCLALKDANIDLDVSGCIFDTRTILQAGFQLDTLKPGTLLVIDLMDMDEGDEDDDDEDAEASLGALVGSGYSGTTMS